MATWTARGRLAGRARGAAFVLVIGLVAPSVARAQGTIATDRPGLGFSAAVVPAGAFQLEAGLPAVAIGRSKGTRTTLTNFPALVRAGLSRGVELRVGSTLYNSQRTTLPEGSERASGFGAVEVGAKLSFGIRGTDVALIPSVILPVGDSRFGVDRTGYTANAIAAWSLPAGFGLTTVAGLALTPAEGGSRTTTGALIAVLGRGLTDRLGGYVEGGLYPTPDLSDPAYVGAGGTVLVTRLFQVDAFVDRGLGPAAPDWLFGLGAAVRVGR